MNTAATHIPKSNARRIDDPSHETNVQEGLKRVHALAQWMDAKWHIPGTQIRFGLDTLVGLLPVAGDSITLLAAIYPMALAKQWGLGRWLMLKMLGNLFLDWLVGLVPGLDLILDTWVKAHLKNAKLLEAACAKRGWVTAD